MNTTPVALAEALLRARTGPLHLLQVGASLGDFSAENSVARLNESSDAVRIAMRRMLQYAGTRALLLEPNPPVFRKLNASIQSDFGAQGRVRARNVAVCSHTHGVVDFFVPAPKLLRDYPTVPYWATTAELASLNRASVVRALKFIEELRWARLYGGKSAGNPEDYVTGLKVPCETPHDVLAAAGIAPKELDALVVDAEGLDAELVEAFVNSSEVRPSLILFEAHVSNYYAASRLILRRLLASLVHYGYHVRCCSCNGLMPTGARRTPRTRSCDTSVNALAWLPSRLEPERVAVEATGSYGLEWGLRFLSAACARLGRKVALQKLPLGQKPNLAKECARAAGAASVEAWWRRPST